MEPKRARCHIPKEQLGARELGKDAHGIWRREWRVAEVDYGNIGALVADLWRHKRQVIVLQQHDGVGFGFLDDRLSELLVVAAKRCPCVVPLRVDHRFASPVIEVVVHVPEGLVRDHVVGKVKIVRVDVERSNLEALSVDGARCCGLAIAVGEAGGHPLGVGVMDQWTNT